MAAILVIANDFDIPTKYGYHWMKRFSQYAASQGHTVILQKTPTLKTLHEALTNYDPKLVVINGHGGRKGVQVGTNVLVGVSSYDPELGLKIHSQNPDWFRGRIVILATCNAGKELAYMLVNYGAEAVQAFREPFIFLSEDHVTNIMRDKLALPFFQSMLQTPIQLVEGRTFGDACQITRSAFEHYRDLAETRGDELSAKYLHYDLENMVCLGSMEATL